ncbi:uncharacterized protein FIBRA_08385 [Fibroporia radiculosa]|uniref:Uncharacterized protein n=1 Tax=Fibroporia radiculosa TaxID=599839 RepID=J4GWP4_9APHY|nr:uncharacterized protein FIBRA_08385 [Fibroporia radiculosa]CCM06135.1 predicted protein [Fibroporia radiculosa]
MNLRKLFKNRFVTSRSLEFEVFEAAPDQGGER